MCCSQTPEHVICQWGLIHVVQADGAVTCLKEKELSSKLELLYNKSLYMLALNLAQSQQASCMSILPCMASLLMAAENWPSCLMYCFARKQAML